MSSVLSSETDIPLDDESEDQMECFSSATLTLSNTNSIDSINLNHSSDVNHNPTEQPQQPQQLQLQQLQQPQQSQQPQQPQQPQQSQQSQQPQQLQQSQQSQQSLHFDENNYFFGVSDGLIERAFEECKPVMLETIDGSLRGKWLLTE